jgi:hypothetical protein
MGGHHNSYVPGECWKLSRGLRAATAGYALLFAAPLYVIVRFFFPRAFLMPILVIAGVVYVALCSARMRVVLDRPGGEAAIILGFWTRRVRLTQIERVESLRFGAEIQIAGGESYGLGPRWKRRWMGRVVRVRSGFEGMDSAITQAAAAARAADVGRTAAEETASRRSASRSKISGACYLCTAGLLGLAMAAVVQPQAGGWFMHSVALLLRIFFVAVGGLFALVSVWLLVSAWRDRRAEGQDGPSGATGGRGPAGI